MPIDHLSTLPYADMLDLLPDGVVCYEAVRDTKHTITDFRLIYYNKAFESFAPRPYKLWVGVCMLADNAGQEDTLHPIVERYRRTVETGEVADYTFFDTNQQATIRLRARKLGDGVLVTTRDVTNRQRITEKAQQQSALFNGILNASLNGIITYSAVRDANGRIVDFRAETVNEVATKVLLLPDNNPGWHLLERFPGVRERGLFDQYIQVVNTGMPMRFETVYESDGLQGWYDVAVVKLADGFVITFNDITVRKRATQQVEQQNTLLEGILNTSLNGTVVYEAIRDEQGRIEDFRFRLFNQTARQDILTHVGKDISGSTLLRVYPDSHESGLFDLYAHVTETGQSLRLEHFYPDVQTWYDVSLTKLNDGCVVTFINISASKRSELAQQQQARLLENVLNTSMNGIAALRAARSETGEIIDFRVETVNQGLSRTSAYSLEELSGMSVMKLDPNLKTSGLFDQYVAVCETGEPHQGEYHYPKTGHWFSISVARQEANLIVVTVTDITPIKEAGRQVEQQAELVNSVLDGALNSIVAYEAMRDPDHGQIVDFTLILANEAAERYLQRSSADLIGQRLLDLYPEERTMGLFGRYVATVETGRPFRSEAVYREHGTESWLDISATKLGDGIVVTFSDVTHTKRASLELERQAEFVSNLLDGSLNGVISLNPVYDNEQLVDFRILSANRAAEAFLNRSEAELIGHGLIELYPENRTMGLFDLYARVLETRRTERMEAYYIDDRVEFWLDSSASPRDSMGLVVSFLDITERKKAQRQTEALVQELRRSNANLEQFAYVASHDLQEPLRKVTAFGDILQNQYAVQLGETGADMVRRMQSAAQRMQTLIKDLLSYSRVANKRDGFHLIDLNGVVHEVLTDLETSLAEKGAHVDIDNLPTLNGDALQLQQLFQNLLSNALKFTKPGRPPVVRITSETVRGRDLSARMPAVRANRLYAQISIRDNGIGFEPQYAERIFQLFQRLHTRSEYLGTGIGLSIVQKVVENHSGYIWAEGQPGIGATFVILLPIRDI